MNSWTEYLYRSIYSWPGKTSIQGLIRNFDARFERNWNGGFSVGLFDLFTGREKSPEESKEEKSIEQRSDQR